MADIPTAPSWVPVIAACVQGSLQAIGVYLAARVAVGLAGQRAAAEHLARVEVERREADREKELELLNDVAKMLHDGVHFGSKLIGVVEAGQFDDENDPHLARFLQESTDWHNGIWGLMARFSAYASDEDFARRAHFIADDVVKLHTAIGQGYKTGNKAMITEAWDQATRQVRRFDEEVIGYLRRVRSEIPAKR